MKDEIIAGLKNAIEREENLEYAIQTFVNSGYNPEEVRAAGKIISESGVSNIVYPPEGNPQQSRNILPFQPKPANKDLGIIFSIIGILIIFLGVIGYLIYKLLI